MSKSERRSFEIEETKRVVLARDGGICFVCGRAAGWQLAHRIPQSDLCISMYGEAVVHHPGNMRLVCSLACNKKVEVSCKSRPRMADEIAQEIRKMIEEESDDAG